MWRTPVSEDQEISGVRDKTNVVLRSPAVPSQESVEAALENCRIFANSLVGVDPSGTNSRNEKSPASTLLSLEKQHDDLNTLSRPIVSLTRPIRENMIAEVSALAYSIVTAPKVFITPNALASYVNTQCLLGRPETLPQVFVLYANKPIPQPNSTPTRYRSSNPNQASCAVSLVLAHDALSAAIEAKDLPLCFDIINTTVCTKAYRRSKILRRALVPITTLAIAPAAAYVLASQMSVYQDTMDNAMATNLAFAGLLAYIGFTATIGVVAVTTANDQMKRVTWTTGLPLRERWLREDERAMVDRVAVAWGFQQISRRGEEEGQDWEALREWAGLRGMVLDRVGLMDGME